MTQPPAWEDTVDDKLVQIDTTLMEIHARLMSLENVINTLEQSHQKLNDLFQKLWVGFETFKDSPMLRMFAGGMFGGKKNAVTAGQQPENDQP